MVSDFGFCTAPPRKRVRKRVLNNGDSFSLGLSLKIRRRLAQSPVILQTSTVTPGTGPLLIPGLREGGGGDGFLRAGRWGQRLCWA